MSVEESLGGEDVTIHVNSHEHDELMKAFEDYAKEHMLRLRLNREFRYYWSHGYLYESGETNLCFLFFRAGYALGRKGQVGAPVVHRAEEEICGKCKHYVPQATPSMCAVFPGLCISLYAPACPYYAGRTLGCKEEVETCRS